eukprot:39380-Pleurochrysis_carterae.AAC.2
MDRGPMGLDAPSAPAVCPGPGPSPPAVRGSRLRLRSRRRFPVGSRGCGGRMSPGSSSIARVASCSGARFRRETKGGGRARAASTAARMDADRPGPSDTQPPVISPSAAAWRACLASSLARSSARARAAFISAG